MHPVAVSIFKNVVEELDPTSNRGRKRKSVVYVLEAIELVLKPVWPGGT